MYVISAFSGVGKSHFAAKFPQALDLDSSQFAKDQFPTNYLDEILARESKRQCTLISTHKAVRDALVFEHVPFIRVYPDINSLDEYTSRYLGRAGTGGLYKQDESWFAKMMAENWNDWILSCAQQTSCMKVVLKPGQFLEDVIGMENGQFKLLR